MRIDDQVFGLESIPSISFDLMGYIDSQLNISCLNAAEPALTLSNLETSVFGMLHPITF